VKYLASRIDVEARGLFVVKRTNRDSVHAGPLEREIAFDQLDDISLV
jgi:hypothetical protein